MKVALLSTLALGAIASSAHAKPRNGAHCVATSEQDLQGDSIAAMATDDASTSTNKLKFQPKSIFIADGYAVKVFSEENFQGVGELDGSFRNLKSLPKTDGGHYVNIGTQYVATAKSFACVPSGKLWSDIKAFHAHDHAGNPFSQPVAAAYYPGTTFTGDQGYHGEYASVSVDEVDGHKILTFDNSYYYINGSKGTIDLDTGTITYTVIDGSWPHKELSTQVIDQDASIKGIDFQYKGVLDSVISILDLVIENPTTVSPAGHAIKVPNLELTALRDVLSHGIHGYN